MADRARHCCSRSRRAGRGARVGGFLELRTASVEPAAGLPWPVSGVEVLHVLGQPYGGCTCIPGIGQYPVPPAGRGRGEAGKCGGTQAGGALPRSRGGQLLHGLLLSVPAAGSLLACCNAGSGQARTAPASLPARQPTPPGVCVWGGGGFLLCSILRSRPGTALSFRRAPIWSSGLPVWLADYH